MRSGERSIGWFQKQIERAVGAPSEARRKARSWRLGGVGLIILCLLVYIPGLWTIPPVDRDESRFAQASRQMLESGTVEGWVVPRVQDRPRLNKPPLIYWLQASSAAILGDKPGQWAWLDGGSENIWVYRVPSVLSAILTVLLTWRIGLRMFDPRAAWLAAALLAVCPMVVWDAHQARADQLLLAMTTATMGCLWCVWRDSKGTKARRHEGTKGEENAASIQTISSSPPSVPSCLRASVPLFWTFLSLGIMTKGPITPLIAGLTVLALCLVSRDWSLLRRLRPLLGLIIVAIVVAPWVILVGNEVGWSKYLSIVYDETIGRSAGAKEGHWGPPGYHIVLLGVLFWPGSLLTAAAIGRAWRRGLKAKRAEAKRNTEGTERSTEGTEKSGGVGEVDGAGSAEVRPEMHAAASRERSRGLCSLRAFVASPLRAFLTSRPGRPAELFCLAWMLPAWIVFELIGTKLPHYTMPLYPAVALMSARAMLSIKAMFLPALNPVRQSRFFDLIARRPKTKCPACKYHLAGITSLRCPECGLELSVLDNGKLAAGYRYDPGQRPGLYLWMFFGCLLGLIMPLTMALWILSNRGAGVSLQWRAWIVVPVALIVVSNAAILLTAVRLIRFNRLASACIAACAICMVTVAGTLAYVLPRASDLWISKRVREALVADGWTQHVPLAGFGYDEDSLVFLTRGALVRLTSQTHLQAWINGKPEYFLVADTAGNVAYHEFLVNQSRPSSWERLMINFDFDPDITGFNYSRGRAEDVYVNHRIPRNAE